MSSKCLRSVFGVVCFGAALLLACIILSPMFDREEAELARGKTYECNDRWRIRYSDGESQEYATLPYYVTAKDHLGESFILENTLEEDYSGLALHLQVHNAAVRIYLDGKPLYDAGLADPENFAGNPAIRPWHMEQRGFLWERGPAEENNPPEDAASQEEGSSPGEQPLAEENSLMGEQPPAEETSSPGEQPPAGENSPMGEQPPAEGPGFMGEQPPGEEPGPMGAMGSMPEPPADNAMIWESVDNLVDLSDAAPGSRLMIQLVPVNKSMIVSISSCTVSKRDIALISRLRGSMLDILCSLVILMCTVILMLIEGVNASAGWPAFGIFPTVLLGGVSLLNSIVRASLLSVFFGNESYFAFLEEVSFAFLPLALSIYAERQLRERSPLLNRLCLGITGIGLILQLLLHLNGILSIDYSQWFSLALLTGLTAVGITAFVKAQIGETGHFEFRPELAALICLLMGAVAKPLYELNPGNIYLNGLRSIGLLLFFVYLSAGRILSTVKHYRAGVEEGRRKADIANEAKGRFLANMSHEIRTPINAVLGMDEMILRETTEEPIRGYAMDIFNAGHTLLSLINDILDFSKIESGKLTITEAEYDLSSLLHDLSNMVNARAEGKGLLFHVEVEESLPSRYYGDDVRIKQVLTNILTNAVKYTAEGSVTLRVKRSGEASGEEERLLLHFEVEDTGIGIKEEDMPKLFSAFERIEEHRNRTIEGTGLGMNITAQLLSLMGAKLQVASEYGKGSRFWFDLPQKVLDETPMGDFAHRAENSAAQYTYAASFTAPEARILVVDDNTMNRRVFQSLLKPLAMQIDEASGGRECLELVRRNRYDLIFLDHMMPEMDGVETFHRILDMKTQPDFPCVNTPVYILTANAVAGARERYLAEGFSGFVSKPIISEKLEAAIREGLPPELIREGEAKGRSGKGAAQDPEAALRELKQHLPEVEGLDWDYALLHLPEEEILKSSLSDFYELLPSQAGKLEEFYRGFQGAKAPLSREAEDALQSYRIRVHGMKSSAAMVGIPSLSGLAKVLEYAARDGKIDEISRLHEVFVAEWMSYREKLRGVFSLGEESGEEKTAVTDPALLLSLLSMIRTAVADFDVDTADKAMKELASFRLPEKGAEKLAELSSAVAELDDTRTAELSGELEELLSASL